MVTKQSDSSGFGVFLPENTTFFAIGADGERVRTEQSSGDQVRDTPPEVRDIANVVLDAVGDAGDTVG